jgi:hypothetical protein
MHARESAPLIGKDQFSPPGSCDGRNYAMRAIRTGIGDLPVPSAAHRVSAGEIIGPRPSPSIAMCATTNGKTFG